MHYFYKARKSISLVVNSKKFIQTVSQLKKKKNKVEEEAWINVEKEFNAYFGVTRRIANQLRQKYCFYVIFFRFSTASINLRVKISSISDIFASVIS